MGFNKIVVNFVKIETTCSKYHLSFPSKLKLHKHIKADCMEKALLSSSTQPTLSISIVITKEIYQSLGSGFEFRGWIYATVSITLTPLCLQPSFNPKSTVCLDTSCGVTLVNKKWLLKYLLGKKISTISTSLKVKRISISKHKSAAFVVLSLYFSGTNNARPLVYISLEFEIHFIEGLWVNLLIDNDILFPECIIIDIEKKSALIRSCGVIIAINAKQQG